MKEHTKQNDAGQPGKKWLAVGMGALLLVVGGFTIGYHMPEVAAKKSRQPSLRADLVQRAKNDSILIGASSDTGVTIEHPHGADTPERAVKKTEKPAALDRTKSYRIRIDKSEHRFELLDGETVVRSWKCAVGKGGLGQKERRGDNMTPVGTFVVDEIDDASYWTHDFGDGRGVIEGAYGPWFISLDTEALSGGAWDGIGIHGTHDPSSLGTDASEGCIRLDNRNLEELHQVARVGMVVEIRD